MIEIKNISKKINNKSIYEDICMQLDEGKIYGFMGDNGCGKTMIFKTILGLIKQDEGFVFINGLDVQDENIKCLDVESIIGKNNYMEDETAMFNIMHRRDMLTKEEYSKLIYLFKELDMLAFKDKKVKTFSLGMKQKLLIIDSLIGNSKILILDEPFNGLDESSVEKVKKLILSCSENKTILISSHIKKDIEDLADVIYVLDKGKILDTIVNDKKVKAVVDKVVYPEVIYKEKYRNAKITVACIVFLIIAVSCVLHGKMLKDKLVKAKMLYNDEKYSEAILTFKNHIILNRDIEYKKIIASGNYAFFPSGAVDLSNKADFKNKLSALVYKIIFQKPDGSINEITKYRLEAYEDVKASCFKSLKRDFKLNDEEIIYIMDSKDAVDLSNRIDKIIVGK
ncbi:MAG: ATP-binding cassette domain-containing protein [Clostridia bacterium]